MSRDLDSLIAAELQQLRMLLEPRRPLVERCLRGAVELESLDALSALLHSSYTAMERILVHIAKREGEYEAIQSKAFTWHAVLLNTLAAPSDKSPAVISEKLHHTSSNTLDFVMCFATRTCMNCNGPEYAALWKTCARYS